MFSKQRGISMLEILITIVVMSFGFLSLASFQMGTLNYLNNNGQHYLATLLAESIGESIKANNQFADQYHEENTTDFNTDCLVTACSIAEWDIWHWQNGFRNHALQNVVGEISIDGNMAIITIQWEYKNNDEEYILQVPL